MVRQAKYLIPGVDSTTPIGEAATKILVSKSRRMFDLEAAAAGGSDVDAVHDMRVASRRTREALSALSPAFKDRTAEELATIAKTVTRSLGAVRDADVFLGQFTRIAANAEGAAERITLAYLIGRREAERAAALRRMRRRLGRLDLKQSRKRFGKVAAATRKGSRKQPLVILARDVLNDRVDTVYSYLPAALEEDNAPDQHAMRIAFKHLRYAVETFAPCFDGGFSRIHNTLIAFQNILGEIHDLDVYAAVVTAALGRDEAVAAGVTTEGVDMILAGLAAERGRQFRRFARLMEQYPEERMRERILGSLVEPPEEVPVEDAAGTGGELHAIPLGTGTSLVVLRPGPATPWAVGPTADAGDDTA